MVATFDIQDCSRRRASPLHALPQRQELLMLSFVLARSVLWQLSFRVLHDFPQSTANHALKETTIGLRVQKLLASPLRTQRLSGLCLQQ